MMCLVLLGGVWEPVVKWRTHIFTILGPDIPVSARWGVTNCDAWGNWGSCCCGALWSACGPPAVVVPAAPAPAATLTGSLASHRHSPNAPSHSYVLP